MYRRGHVLLCPSPYGGSTEQSGRDQSEKYALHGVLLTAYGSGILQEIGNFHVCRSLLKSYTRTPATPAGITGETLVSLLEQLCAKRHGEECFLWDVAWWVHRRERLLLAVESELGDLKAQRRDFDKLRVAKCPTKLMIVKNGANLEPAKREFEDYLQNFAQNVAGEHYLLVDLVSRECFDFKVEVNGKQSPSARFKPLRVSKSGSKLMSEAAGRLAARVY